MPADSSSSPSAGAAVNQQLEKLPAPVAAKVPRVPETKEQLKAEAKAAASSGLSQLRAFAAGGFGGVCAVVIGHPFDLVKVRMQTAERGVYSSAIDVVRKSIARDGLRRGLYAGVSAPLVGVTPMCEFHAPVSEATAIFPLTSLRSQSPSPSGATTSASKSSATSPPCRTRASPSARSRPRVSSPPSP